MRTYRNGLPVYTTREKAKKTSNLRNCAYFAIAVLIGYTILDMALRAKGL